MLSMQMHCGKKLSNASKRILLSAGLPELHADDVKASAGASLARMEEIQAVIAFAGKHMKRPRPICLLPKWAIPNGALSRELPFAGLSLKAYPGSLNDFEVPLVTPYKWREKREAQQADNYLQYIFICIVDEDQYCIFDARRSKQLLTVAGMQAQLAFEIRGTTDAALVFKQNLTAGIPANGLRWLWQLERPVCASTAGVLPESTPWKGSSSSHFEDQSQQDNNSLPASSACQAMAALLLANIHAPHLKPAVNLTDLGDKHVIYWLDGFHIMFYAAPSVEIAWAVNEVLLGQATDGYSSKSSTMTLPENLRPLANQQKPDVSGMHCSGGELAQLASISDCISNHEYKFSTCAVQQLAC